MAKRFLPRAAIVALGNALERDRKLLKSGDMTWKALEEKYNKELQCRVTRSNIKNLAKQMNVEVNCLRVVNRPKGMAKRDNLQVALCQAISDLCHSLGANEIKGLDEIRRHLDSKIKTNYISDELPRSLK